MSAEKFREHHDELDLIQKKDHRESGWRGVNSLTQSGQKKQEKLEEGLEKFQKATGIDESKYIKELRECKSDGEIFALEKKMKKAAVKWYEIQMKKSGIYDPIDRREASLLNQEMEGLINWFAKQPLAGDESMISTLSELEKNMEPAREFRKKLKKQSAFVKNEYFRRLGSLPLVGSKKDLLNNILEEIKEVEDAPSAVQYEFKKRQKAAGANKKTAEIKENVLKGYEKRIAAYTKDILANEDVFGGKKVQSPYGKISLTALEFIEWFEEQKSFAAMDSAQKKLPNLIKQRKRLYEKRDDILKHALPKDKERLTKRTNLMRRHELEEFLPELEKNVRRNSIHVAEYMSSIIGARTKGISLFLPLEKTLNIRKFQLNDLETQKARLKVLDAEIKERDEIVKDYTGLPPYLRNDARFINASAIERESLLLDAKEQQNKEKDDPFDYSDMDDLDGSDTRDITNKLQSHEGEKMMEKVVEEMKQEGLAKAAEVQEQTYWKIFGAAKRAEKYEETQKQSYLRDLKYWVKMDQDIKDESDVRTERQRNKWLFVEAADQAYDLGYTMTSGGEIEELQTINAKNLEDGTGDVLERLNRAKYGEHVKIDKADGGMAEDPLELIERLSEQELMKMMFHAINKLGRKHMKMSAAQVNTLKNSNNIQQEIAHQMVGSEFSHLAANDNGAFARKRIAS